MVTRHYLDRLPRAAITLTLSKLAELEVDKVFSYNQNQ